MTDIVVSPLAGWEIGTVKEMGVVILQLRYLSHSMQPASEAHSSPRFLLSPEQAQELAALLAEQASLVQKSPPKGAPRGTPEH